MEKIVLIYYDWKIGNLSFPCLFSFFLCTCIINESCIFSIIRLWQDAENRNILANLLMKNSVRVCFLLALFGCWENWFCFIWHSRKKRCSLIKLFDLPGFSYLFLFLEMKTAESMQLKRFSFLLLSYIFSSAIRRVCIGDVCFTFYLWLTFFSCFLADRDQKFLQLKTSWWY